MDRHKSEFPSYLHEYFFENQEYVVSKEIKEKIERVWQEGE